MWKWIEGLGKGGKIIAMGYLNILYSIGQSYELAIKDGAINATDVGKIKSPAGAVTRIYDPAYMNTVNCISKISYINGDKGILEYRGYPIE